MTEIRAAAAGAATPWNYGRPHDYAWNVAGKAREAEVRDRLAAVRARLRGEQDPARQADFDARLDNYRARYADRTVYDEAADMYDPGVPTPLDYREMRDDWPPYPPPPEPAPEPGPASPERCSLCGYLTTAIGHRLACEES